MGNAINSLVFRPPSPPTYQPGGNLSWLYTADGDRIPTLWINANANLTLLYSHCNAEDIGCVAAYFLHQSSAWDCNVLLYDYPGYGLASSSPSEQGCYSAVEACYWWLREKKKIPWNKIVVYGRSLGSGPSCHLASRLPVRGVIIQSGILSVHRVPFDHRITLPGDMFCNIDKISHVQCPVFIIHGHEDEVVPVTHALELSRRAPCAVNPYIIADAGHNDVEIVGGDNFYDNMTNFLSYLRKSRPRNYIKNRIPKEQLESHPYMLPFRCQRLKKGALAQASRKCLPPGKPPNDMPPSMLLRPTKSSPTVSNGLYRPPKHKQCRHDKSQRSGRYRGRRRNQINDAMTSFCGYCESNANGSLLDNIETTVDDEVLSRRNGRRSDTAERLRFLASAVHPTWTTAGGFDIGKIGEYSHRGRTASPMKVARQRDRSARSVAHHRRSDPTERPYHLLASNTRYQNSPSQDNSNYLPAEPALSSPKGVMMPIQWMYQDMVKPIARPAHQPLVFGDRTCFPSQRRGRQEESRPRGHNTLRNGSQDGREERTEKIQRAVPRESSEDAGGQFQDRSLQIPMESDLQASNHGDSGVSAKRPPVQHHQRIASPRRGTITGAPRLSTPVIQELDMIATRSSLPGSPIRRHYKETAVTTQQILTNSQKADACMDAKMPAASSSKYKAVFHRPHSKTGHNPVPLAQPESPNRTQPANHRTLHRPSATSEADESSRRIREKDPYFDVYTDAAFMSPSPLATFYGPMQQLTPSQYMSDPYELPAHRETPGGPREKQRHHSIANETFASVVHRSASQTPRATARRLEKQTYDRRHKGDHKHQMQVRKNPSTPVVKNSVNHEGHLGGRKMSTRFQSPAVVVGVKPKTTVNNYVSMTDKVPTVRDLFPPKKHSRATKESRRRSAEPLPCMPTLDEQKRAEKHKRKHHKKTGKGLAGEKPDAVGRNSLL